MQITSLILCGYRRFALNNINKFIFNPTKNSQLILGSNGCGKSSLIKELTPLPPSADDFSKGGYKTIHITNHSDNFILHSTFNPVKHSFIKNDIELNPGGTITVFRELVRQEFSVTHEIHDLLVGDELFTNMSPLRRREWFTKLSNVNYDYALGVYNKLRERHRDTLGAIKLAKNRLTNESAKLISKEEENKLRQDVEITHRELTILRECSAPLEQSVDHFKSIRNNHLKELESLSLKLLRLKCSAPYGSIYPYGLNTNKMFIRDDWGSIIQNGFESVDEVEEVIRLIENDIAALAALLNNSVNEYSKISDKILILEKANKDGVEGLQSKLVILDNFRSEIISKCKLGLIIEDNELLSAINAFNNIYDIISDIVLVISENIDQKYSSSKIEQLSIELLEYKNNKVIKTSDLAKLESKKLHLESHKHNGNTTCPKCSHVWVPGYSEEHLELLVTDINKVMDDLISINNKIELIEKEINDNREYGKLYNDYIRCTNNWPLLKPLWNYIFNNEYLKHSPRFIISIMDSFKFDLECQLEASKINSEISEIKTLIKSTEAIGDVNLNDLKNSLNDYTIDIDNKTFKLNSLKHDLIKYTNYSKQLSESFILGNKINEIKNNCDKANDNMIEMIRRETLNHCMRQLQSSLALKETTLNGINIQNAIIEDLKNQINKLVLEEEATRILVQKLSPVEGLIAEGLLGFIKHFISSMNQLIKKIWSYKLVIHDCGLDNGELNYKFPVTIQTRDNKIPDVKFGSVGMLEIFNLAFKVTSMMFLNLNEYPLYLDEWDSGLDHEHKLAGMKLISSLVLNGDIGQMFIINHNYSQYGSFTNFEVCVLDSKNVIVPDVFNTHVIME